MNGHMNGGKLVTGAKGEAAQPMIPIVDWTAGSAERRFTLFNTPKMTRRCSISEYRNLLCPIKYVCIHVQSYPCDQEETVIA